MSKEHRNPENGRVEFSPLYNAPSKIYVPSIDEEEENFNSINNDVPEHIIEGERCFFKNDGERNEFWSIMENKWDSWDNPTQKKVIKFIDQYVCD